MIKELRSNMFTLKYNRSWVGPKGEDSCKVLTIFIRIVAVVLAILMLFCVIKKMLSETHDLAVTSLCIFGIGLFGPSLGKLIGLIQYSEVYKKILNQLEAGLFEKFKITGDELKHIENAEKWIAKFIKRYIRFTFVGCLGLIFMPLWRKIFAYFDMYPKNASVGFILPTWSPFDENDYLGYAAVYIVQIHYLYTVWTIWVGTDAIFAGSIIHICAHFNIISDRLANWKHNASLKLNSISELKRDLRNIIKYHIEILRLGKELNSVSERANLHQLFFITIIICCCGIQTINSSKEKAPEVLNGFFVMLCMLQSWLIICFMGTKIITESEKVAEAIYFSDWISLTTKERKILCYVLFRSQKPMYMTTGKFFKISLGLYLDMVKMSYSLLAVLRGMYD